MQSRRKIVCQALFCFAVAKKLLLTEITCKTYIDISHLAERFLIISQMCFFVLPPDGIASFDIDLPGKKVIVKTDLSSDQVLELLKKSGKSTAFVGES